MHDYYTDKVYDQITTTSSLRAQRGNIYDTNMNLLATTNTSWRVFISTKDIKKAEKESGKKYSKIISNGLASILSLDASTLLKKIEQSNVLDITVKKSATKNECLAVMDFVVKNSLESLVFTEAQSSRYYPESTLAAHVLGFSGSDNQGLYGLEYYYDSFLSGTDGYYLYAKDANGNALSTEYATCVPAKDGYSLVTTIDTYVQAKLESQLAQAVQNHNVTGRATGIVMDVKTGAILAMATSSPFDPNNPYELDELSKEKLASCGFAVGSSEYTEYKKELLEVMWSNKAITETYEPGSTFKIITVASAVDLGVVNMNDTFSCRGYHTVGGWRIKCHKIKGHGASFPLSYGLQMSCNPTMMQVAERVGSSNFYSYIEGFGYFEKSGIDLPSEASTIFHKEEAIGSTELATASFGQRFKVTVINHLNAICAVANGGKLVTPYVVEKIIDENGDSVYEHEVEVKRQVISEAVAAEVSAVLEKGVSGEGGAKNARVEGYQVAAKTGTSEKFDVLDENGNSYLRIGSTVAYNISADGGIATIIVVDEPQSNVKYGSVVAAPYVSALLSDVLPYLEFKSTSESNEISVPNMVGLPVESATQELKKLNLKYEIIGDGSVVLSQTPTLFDKAIPELCTIYIYTDKKQQLVSVPSLVGMSVAEATKAAIDTGLNIELTGSGDGGTVIEQSLPSGAVVEKGSVIKLKTMVTDFED
ncbi:MAG: PASTA domain-containing protein [Clostridia bacterium]|nr:PASTA domain-containing protein [Clostridia bacterium]